MKKFMVVMAVFVLAAGSAVVVNASDVPALRQSLEPENYAGHVELFQISEPIGTGAVPARVEVSKEEASKMDALRRSLEPENYAGHPDTN